jgi:hypothetical protein
MRLRHNPVLGNATELVRLRPGRSEDRGFLYLTVARAAAGTTSGHDGGWRRAGYRRPPCDGTTGLPQPTRDFPRLGSNVEAYALRIETHYILADVLLAARDDENLMAHLRSAGRTCAVAGHWTPCWASREGRGRPFFAGRCVAGGGLVEQSFA